MTEQNVELESWSRLEEWTSRRKYAPPQATLGQEIEALAAEVKDAVARGRHVRALGSLWSFPSVVRAPDLAVDVSGLDDVIVAADSGGLPKRLHDMILGSQLGGDRRYALVGAGIQVFELLDRLGTTLSPRTLGSSSGQTVSGVLSTGSHGGDFDRPPIADAVRAVVVVGYDGVVRWLEPDDTRLTKAGAKVDRLVPATRVRDTRAFEAALVGAGALGVIVAYVIELRTAYALSERVAVQPWSTLRGQLVNGGAAFGAQAPWFAGADGRYRYLEILLNPYRTSDNYDVGAPSDRSALVCCRFEHDAVAPAWPRPGAEVNLFKVLATLHFGGLPQLRQRVDDLTRGARKGTPNEAPRLAQSVMNTGNDPSVRVRSYDASLPLDGDRHLAFLDAVLDAFDRRFRLGKRFAGFLSLRYTLDTRASLSRWGTDGIVQHVECFALQELKNVTDNWDPRGAALDSELFLEDFHAVAVDHGAEFHWGQLGSHLGPGRAGWDDWTAGRDELLPASARASFANGFTHRAQLTTPPTFFGVADALPREDSDASWDARHAALAEPQIVGGHLYASNADGWAARIPLDALAGPGSRWELVARYQRGLVDDDTPRAGEQIRGGVTGCLKGDDTHELFATFDDGRVYHRWEDGIGAAHPPKWTKWTRMDDERFAARPACARDGEGRILIAGVERSGVVLWRRQKTFGWSGWEPCDASPDGDEMVGSPALVWRDGKSRLYASTAGGLFGLDVADGQDPGAWTRVASAIGEPAAATGKFGTTAATAIVARTGRRKIGVFLRRSGSANALTELSLPEPPLEGTRPAVCVAGVIRVAVTLESGDVCVYTLTRTGAPERKTFEDVGASSGPRVSCVDGRWLLAAKVAHDLVVARFLS